MTVRLLEEPDESLPAYQPFVLATRRSVKVWMNRLRATRSGSPVRRLWCVTVVSASAVGRPPTGLRRAASAIGFGATALQPLRRIGHAGIRNTLDVITEYRGVILTVRYLIIIALIAARFWDYWITLI